MSKGATDDTAETSDRDIISNYDQSFSVGKDGTALPIVHGERKVAGVYVISGFYGQHTKQVQTSGGKK